MEFIELPAYLKLRPLEWSLFLGFFNFNEEPAERMYHLCQVEAAQARKALSALLKRKLVRKRSVRGRELFSLAPFDALVKKIPSSRSSGQLRTELAQLQDVLAHRGAPGCTIVAHAGQEVTDKLDPLVVDYVHTVFPALDLRLGTICNFNCLYCLVGHEKKQLNSYADILSSLRFARTQQVEKVTLTGGEPTLHPELPRIIASAKDLGFKEIVLVTNGALIARPELLDEYIRLGVTAVGISFDTPDKRTAEQLWRREAYDLVVRAFDAVARHPDIPLGVIAVINALNYEQLPELARFFIKLKKKVKGLFIPNLDFIMPEENAWIHRDIMIPKLTAVIPSVQKALKLAHTHKLALTYRGIPLCLLPGQERYSFDRYITIFNLLRTDAGVVFDRTSLDLRRTKVPDCRACVYYHECPGLSRGYVNRFGTSEIKGRAIRKALT